jgi:excisionase family DNA binding protein
MPPQVSKRITRLPPSDRLAFTVGDLAARIGIHPHTLHRAIHQGRLRAVRHARRYYIPRSAALEFIGEQEAARTDPGRGEA